MCNKNALFSLCASIFFINCMASTSLNDEFLRKTNRILNSKIERVELDFRVDGKAGKGVFWVMKKEQFQAFKDLIEYAVAGCAAVQKPDGKAYLEFTSKLGFKQDEHFCGARKASLFEKVVMCVKTKSIKPFTEDPYVRDSNSYTHVMIRADLRIDEFKVVDIDSRLYRNVPETSQIGNLPGIYLRGDGKTTNTGDLVGFSFRPEKDGQIYDYFFGKLWIEQNN